MASIPASRSTAAAAYVASSKVLSSLNPDLQRELAAELEPVHLPAGGSLFESGDERDAMYIVAAGRLRITRPGAGAGAVTTQEVTAGQTVGEMGLIAGGPRSETACAVEDSDLLRLSRADFERLCETYPEAMAQLPASIVPNMWDSLLTGVISEWLGELDASELRAIQAELECLRLSRGDALIRQGEEADCMYVVIYGRLREAMRDPDGSERVVDELGRGATVGEHSMLSGDVHTSTVSALRDTGVARVSRQVFNSLQRQYPEVMTRIARAALRRVQRQAATPEARHAMEATSLAVLAVGAGASAGLLSEFAGRLAQVLTGTGTTLYLTSARLDSLLGTPGIANTAAGQPAEPMLVAWLDRQENGHRYIVYQADPTLGPWTERCLRQADRVLLVGYGASAPVAGPLDDMIATWSDSTQTDLVLIQPESIRQPAGTAAWLERYPAATHHHVRLGRPADIQSLARRITGRGLGLVLGGGGARGYAHIGVFRALDEAGITVDMVGGTSMGAILSATFAMGLDYDAHMKLARQLSSPLRLFDPTMPVVSVFASGKVTRVLEKLYGDTQIEDLWLPCFCVSSNLTHAVQMVHRRGPLWQAVRASMAIPGVFSPILCDGDLLVDGCVLNNLPIDVMQRLNLDGPIIAVNVFPDVDLLRDYRFGPSVSGWEALLAKLNPLGGDRNAPLIFESLLRVLALNDVHQAKAKRGFADLYIRPPVERYNILDFGAYRDIAEIGYQSGREAIASWPRWQPKASPANQAAEPAAPADPAGNGKDVVTALRRTLDDLDSILQRW